MNPAVTTPSPVTTPTRHWSRDLIRTARPRQWSKNLLVFGAPAAAGILFQPQVIWDAVLALVAFTLAASGTYLLNDVIDAPADRRHPVKRTRPVAAGLIAPRVAMGWGVVLILAGLSVATVLGRGGFIAALAAYVGLTVSYTLWLKEIVVVDLVAVAAGFGLRAIGGAYAVGVPVSQWFLIFTFFGALFAVSGKRYGEHQRLGPLAGEHRRTLASYAEFYHQHVMTLASGITLTAYGLWGYQHGFLADAWFLLSFVVLVMVLLRFALLVHAGASDDPLEIVWRDRPTRVLSAAWVLLVVAGIALS
jgi:decaprenyl-phosphate phosphoribosyltransferase